jgi:hypothetical protein
LIFNFISLTNPPSSSDEAPEFSLTKIVLFAASSSISSIASVMKFPGVILALINPPFLKDGFVDIKLY